MYCSATLLTSAFITFQAVNDATSKVSETVSATIEETTKVSAVSVSRLTDRLFSPIIRHPFSCNHKLLFLLRNFPIA